MFYWYYSENTKLKLERVEGSRYKVIKIIKNTKSFKIGEVVDFGQFYVYENNQLNLRFFIKDTFEKTL